ncbi:alpha/beta-hydrolase family protein [Rhodococcus sp. NPDC058514]|uniref:alpha/beta-hydrolase family protein n=1 Tax=unclassified Rhodococcus (in: high G+C Gram-positive bacteria) TaxID=192944 RepID=UPI00365ADBD6
MTAVIERPAATADVAATVALPRVLTSVAVTSMVVVSLAPSLLPRSAVVQAILTGLLAALGWGVASAWHHRPRRRGLARPAPSRDSARLLVLLAGALTATAAMLLADHWQDSLRVAMGVPTIGGGHWAQVVAGGGAIALTLAAGATAVAACSRRLGRIRSAAVVVALVLTTQFWAGPALWQSRAHSYSSANSTIDTALRQPDSPSISGSHDSLTSWDSLGAQGRKFVAGAGATGAVRTYVGLDNAPDLDARVRLAVRELERGGGLRKSDIVVAVPTGSGWIDGSAARGFEQRFGGDVALVGVQYSSAPSWVTFLFDRDAAEQSARALFTAVSDRLAQLPADARPRLHVYGQSLGAVGASSILRDAGLRERACGALYAGPPAGSSRTEGAVVLANSSDPVVRWSPRLLLRPPALDQTRADAPRPTWLPVVSFVQTSVDLLSALDAPAGHGHRYGTDQGTALPDRGCAARARVAPQ